MLGLSLEKMKPDVAPRFAHVANGNRHIVNVAFLNVLGNFIRSPLRTHWLAVLSRGSNCDKSR